MQGIKWEILWLLYFVSHNMFSGNFSSLNGTCGDYKPDNSCHPIPITEYCSRTVCRNLSSPQNTINALKTMDQLLLAIDVSGPITIPFCNLVVLIFQPSTNFTGLQIYVNEAMVAVNPVPNSTVSVQLPGELNVGPKNKIVFSVFKWNEANQTMLGTPYELCNRQLVGLSVKDKTIEGLHERVNITMELTQNISETQQPSCQFLNFSTNSFSPDGCITQWTRGQTNLTCSCNHLTYFGVLLITASISAEDSEILNYISLIGCSLSLSALVITVLLFATNRILRVDVSMKVHINLVIALMLLNLHFLLSSTVPAQTSTGLCFYMALVLHYSLLATFSWMALEGFHLYLLLVKVFNIYVQRYLLKLSMVGWGVPAVIVSVVVIINTGFYGETVLNTADDNNATICYISNPIVKHVTSLGPFSMVFLFNVTLLGVALRHVLILRRFKEFGQGNRDRAKKDVFTLLGVITLLGITWGLIFFSFGFLTTAGLYIFCILNSLQGLFIFLWFMMSLRKGKNAATKRSSEIRSISR